MNLPEPTAGLRRRPGDSSTSVDPHRPEGPGRTPVVDPMKGSDGFRCPCGVERVAGALLVGVRQLGERGVPPPRTVSSAAVIAA